MKYDFEGWATRADILCSDGRTIMKDAFRDQDGEIVPLIWNHEHDDPTSVLGHALLKSKDGSMYAYGFFNDTESGQTAKKLVDHGDVTCLSICANKLRENGGMVQHGKIRELSLVLAGANEGARIESVITHSDTGEEELAYIFNDGETIELNHSGAEVEAPEKKGAEKVATEEKVEKTETKEKTVKEVVDSMTDEQREVLYALVGAAAADNGEDDEDDEDDEEESTEMKHNVFENEPARDVLTHSDFEAIKTNAKRVGSFRDAFNEYTEGMLMHDGQKSTSADHGTFVARTENTPAYMQNEYGNQYGIGNFDYLFPEARNLNVPPAFIKRDTGWVQKVMSGVHNTPFSRIKSMFADITEDAARAKGYIKGKYKKEEFFSLMKRSTTPTTVYKKQRMDRDDIIDITDFDVVAWLKREMRLMLDEELARAILIGDGRLASDDDKIDESCIRPVATDADLYTVKVNMADTGVQLSGVLARDFINAIVYNRKKYKGSGNPTLFTTEDMLTECLMLTDDIGRDLYDSVDKLATKLRVKEIVTVPVLDNTDYLGIIVNLTDYTVGADKGGAVNMFDDFDIDYNQQKYLIETRCSGALTVPYSAIVITKAA